MCLLCMFVRTTLGVYVCVFVYSQGAPLPALPVFVAPKPRAVPPPVARSSRASISSSSAPPPPLIVPAAPAMTAASIHVLGAGGSATGSGPPIAALLALSPVGTPSVSFSASFPSSSPSAAASSASSPSSAQTRMRAASSYTPSISSSAATPFLGGRARFASAGTIAEDDGDEDAAPKTRPASFSVSMSALPARRHSDDGGGFGGASLDRNVQDDIKKFQLSGFASEHFSKFKLGRIFRTQIPVEDVLTFQSEPLEKNLMKSAKAERADAIALFQHVVHFMGDGDGSLKKAANALVAWVRETCIKKPVLRDEVFAQLCKQCTRNPQVTLAVVFRRPPLPSPVCERIMLGVEKIWQQISFWSHAVLGQIFCGRRTSDFVCSLKFSCSWPCFVSYFRASVGVDVG